MHLVSALTRQWQHRNLVSHNKGDQETSLFDVWGFARLSPDTGMIYLLDLFPTLLISDEKGLFCAVNLHFAAFKHVIIVHAPNRIASSNSYSNFVPLAPEFALSTCLWSWIYGIFDMSFLFLHFLVPCLLAHQGCNKINFANNSTAIITHLNDANF